MATVQLAGNGVGGTVEGAYGVYQSASDGTFTVDTRDAPTMLTLGMTYVKASVKQQTFAVPAAAAVGKFVASVALSNGALTIANQPDVPRPAAVIVGAGSAAITALTVNATYIANDGTTQVDALNIPVASGATATQFLSKGVVHFTTLSVSGLAGGSSPFIHVDSVAGLSVIVDNGAVDFAVLFEEVDTTSETATLIPSALGSFYTGTAPNGTHNFNVLAGYISPTA